MNSYRTDTLADLFSEDVKKAISRQGSHSKRAVTLTQTRLENNDITRVKTLRQECIYTTVGPIQFEGVIMKANSLYRKTRVGWKRIDGIGPTLIKIINLALEKKYDKAKQLSHVKILN